MLAEKQLALLRELVGPTALAGVLVNRSCGARMHSVRACAKAAMSKAGTSRSSTVGRTVNLRGFPELAADLVTVGCPDRRDRGHSVGAGGEGGDRDHSDPLHCRP